MGLMRSNTKIPPAISQLSKNTLLMISMLTKRVIKGRNTQDWEKIFKPNFQELTNNISIIMKTAPSNK
jgi:hypothetical protein